MSRESGGGGGAFIRNVKLQRGAYQIWVSNTEEALIRAFTECYVSLGGSEDIFMCTCSDSEASSGAEQMLCNHFSSICSSN